MVPRRFLVLHHQNFSLFTSTIPQGQVKPRQNPAILAIAGSGNGGKGKHNRSHWNLFLMEFLICKTRNFLNFVMLSPADLYQLKMPVFEGN